MSQTNVFTPFRVASSLAARSNASDLQHTVTNYEQMALKTYNIPPVYSTTATNGRPSSYEEISVSGPMSPSGITAIDSSSQALELTLGSPLNNGTQKEFFLLYNRSNLVTVTYNSNQTLELSGNLSYYKLLYTQGTWNILNNH